MFKPVLGFVGLTHLGISYSVTAAEKGFQVYAFDKNKRTIKKFLKLETNVYEKNLKKLMKKHLGKKLVFYDDLNNLKYCNIVFISEDVPTDNKGKSNLFPLKKIIKETLKLLRKDTTLVILSQVPPGFNRKIKWSQSRLYYQVETLIFGNAIHRALNPERIIIGKHSSKHIIEKNYNYFLNSYNCPILEMNFESAELTKIAINMFLIASVSNTNLLSSLCEKIEADWSDIIPALRMDKRIGKHAYIEAGLGLSGGNLERDLFTLKSLSNKLNIKDKIINSYISSSNNHKLWVYKKLKELILNKKKKINISILGLSYKENTNSIKNSASIYLLNKLTKYNVTTYDPMANTERVNIKINRVESISLALKNADVLILMTKWDEFNKITKSLIFSNMKGNIIIDPFGILKNLNLENYDFNYNRLGN